MSEVPEIRSAAKESAALIHRPDDHNARPTGQRAFPNPPESSSIFPGSLPPSLSP